MQCLRVAGFLACLACILHGGVGKNQPNPIRLLDDAYQLMQSFSPEERVISLLGLAQAATLISPERADRWSQQLFKSTQDLPLGQLRAAMQKNALRTLAVHDPDCALALYRRQDLPSQWMKPGAMGEDPRSLGEGTIFQPIWQHWGYAYLHQLEDLANYLASTGQYPYKAMAKIAAGVGPKHESQARKLISDATSGFMQDRGFLSTNQEFVQFIIATHRLASARQIRRELHAVVPALERHEKELGHAKWLISVITPAGTATFPSKQEALLFRLLPLLRMYLPEKARELLGRYPGLRAAPRVDADMPTELAGAVSMSGTADSPRMRKVLDESLLFHVQEISGADPQQARRMADQITDRALRILALVSLAPYFASSDAQHSREWLNQGKQALAAEVNPQMQERLAAGLASAYLNQHAPDKAEGFTQQAFHLGISLVETSLKNDPRQFSYMATGYDELIGLTELTCKLGPAEAPLVSKIRQVTNPHLRAALLIAAAKGLSERPTYKD